MYIYLRVSLPPTGVKDVGVSEPKGYCVEVFLFPSVP